jgi:hypothetical protein
MTATAKHVLITVNPGLVAGKRMMTVRAMVTVLDKLCDLVVVPISEIDFKRGKITGYRRAPGGKFERCGSVKAKADLWINYTDGYYLDARKLGFTRRTDYLMRQLEFYERSIDTGAVSQVVNTPESERATLKDWFVRQDCKKLRMISTYLATTFGEVCKLLKEHKSIVAKPNWGGDGMSVRKLNSQEAIKEFVEGITAEGETLHDYVFQPYREGAEKRLWFAGNECVGGRSLAGRTKPWALVKGDPRARIYNRGADFERDLSIAKKIWKLSGLSIGSVDFIGDEVNEINGCGTTFIQYQDWDKIADARPGLLAYLERLVKA